MSRRIRRRTSAVTLSPLLGLGGLTASRYLTCAASDGAGAGFYVTHILRPTALGAGYSYFGKLYLAGWSLGLAGAADTLTARIVDGTTATVTSPAYTVATNRVICVCAVHTGTHVRLYVQGVEVGSGTAITGYTPLSGVAYIGASGGGATYVDWFGSGSGLGVPSAQNVADWYAAVRSTRRIQQMIGVAAGVVYQPTATGAAPAGAALVGTGHVLLAERNPVWG